MTLLRAPMPDIEIHNFCIWCSPSPALCNHKQTLSLHTKRTIDFLCHRERKKESGDRARKFSIEVTQSYHKLWALGACPHKSLGFVQLKKDFWLKITATQQNVNFIHEIRTELKAYSPYASLPHTLFFNTDFIIDFWSYITQPPHIVEPYNNTVLSVSHIIALNC